MPTIKETIEQFYQAYNVASSKLRREDLILEMDKLEKSNVHCYSCPGTCCTYMANSMQITPLEAFEILAGLEIDQKSAEDKTRFKKQMNETITHYRLNVEVYTGKRNSQALRKNYTCPFFNNGSLGCGLSRGIKPYGCLGFNPKDSSDNGKSCASNIDLLQKREDDFLVKEDLLNSHLKTHFNLLWTKKSIPEALLEVLFALEKR